MRAVQAIARAGGAALIVLGCATLASEAGDSDAVRPNAKAGPFRALRSDELENFGAPNVLEQENAGFREPTVLDLDASDELGESALYAVATLAGVPGIYRFVAADGRSFAEKPSPAAPVLEVSEPWEGGAIDAPEVAEVDGEIWLFYSAAGGIGLARSKDGAKFTKEAGPVLGTTGAAAWEAGEAPRAPAFLELGAGDYRLFYEAAGHIGEAESGDGTLWTRRADGPVLEPGSASGPDGPAFDSASVGDPEAWRATTAEGRSVTRVYYAGRAADGSSSIGLAARFAGSGKLERAPAPAFTSPRGPHAPSIVAYRELTLLFVTQEASSTKDYSAVAVGIAPATVSIKVP